MARVNNLKNQKKFVKDDPRINRNGRPPKLLKSLLSELEALGYERVKPSDAISLIETLLNLNQDELTKIALDKGAPMITRIVAKAMLSSKGFETIEKLLDRAHGKAAVKTILVGDNDAPPINISFKG